MVTLKEYKKMVIITAEEAEKLDVSFVKVMGRNKHKSCTQARTKAMKRIYKALPVSYQEVGYFFRRHHTTVMHANKKRFV